MIEPYTEEDIRHIERGLIFFCKHGSHAYGLNTPESDIDLRGIYIGPPEHVFGTVSRREQYDKFTFNDTQIWELRKFIKLASECNPNMIEILFVSERATIYSSLWWKMLVNMRELFLSKQAALKFSKYAEAQLKRMKGHKKWINNPQPEEEPKQENFTKQVFDRDDARKYVIVPDREAYKQAHRAWKQYWHWKRNRNPDRAVLEEKYGYDTKHAMHLVRLLRMGREILDGWGVIVDRSELDGLHLLNIRNGKLTYDELILEGEVILEDIERLKDISTLPKKAAQREIEKKMIEIYFSYWEEWKRGDPRFRTPSLKDLLKEGEK